MSFADPAQNIQHFGLAAGMKVADFGAGAGAYTLLLAKRVEDGKVYAIDVQKELLERLAREARAKHISNVEVVWGDIEKVGGTKLRDGSLDAVIISNVLFQAKAGYSVALEAARVLRLGGVAIVIDWSDSFGGLGPHPADVITADKAEKIFAEAGFKLIGEFPAGPHHWGRRFKKGS